MRYYLNPIMIMESICVICGFVLFYKGLKELVNKKDDETKKDMTINELYRQILILFVVLSALIVFRH